MDARNVAAAPVITTPEHQEPGHDAPAGVQLAAAQAQAALEQDEADGEVDGGLEQVAEQLVGVEDAEAGAHQQTGRQQHQDARQPEPPRDPLRADADRGDQRQRGEDVGHRDLGPLPPEMSRPRWHRHIHSAWSSARRCVHSSQVIAYRTWSSHTPLISR